MKSPSTTLSSKTCGRRKHSALRHELRESDAPKKRGLAALIGARDDDQTFLVRLHLVADRPLVQAEHETDVVQILARESAGVDVARGWEGERSAEIEEPSVEVQTADIERQFGLQHAKEAFDVLDALGQGVRGEGDAPVPEFRYSPRSRFVAGSEIECVGVRTTTPKKAVSGGPLENGPERAYEPVSFNFEGPAQGVILPPEAFSQSCADEDAVFEIQTTQLFVDEREILIVELVRKHGEELGKAIRTESGRMPIG